ncbi:hypothetical protein CQA63_03865 [Helicobacter marmotae]|uniref:Uncharacterized protein n=1 Tax=Helicobacter marmotae TaxID=152490 RepID=A0A3D8I4N8_9HELI|nr:hypothetical protein [Helicobacter marmotae]RDU60099.1 hypothetical protein CQA63_03865 [Helicobacter marmotae]
MREKTHTKNISYPSCDSKQKASEASLTSYIHKPCEKSLLDFLTTPLGYHVLGARSRGEESLQNPHTTQLLCHSEGFMPEESLLDLLTTLLVCHSEGGQSPTEESLNESLVTHRDSSPSTRVQNDNESNPQDKITSQGKLVCHHEPPIKGKESLLKTLKGTTSDSLRDSSVVSTPARADKLSYPQGKLFCHSELSQESEESLLSTKDSLNESLESPQRFFGAEAQRHDNESNPQDKITLQRKLACHSERSEESLKESLVAHRDSSAFTKPQNDKLTAFTRNPKSNASALLRHNNLTKSLVNQIAFLHSIPNFLEVRI